MMTDIPFNTAVDKEGGEDEQDNAEDDNTNDEDEGEVESLAIALLNVGTGHSLGHHTVLNGERTGGLLQPHTSSDNILISGIQ